MKNIDDKSLLIEISNGKESAFTELYRRYFIKLNAYLTRIYKSNEAHASDILQEAFLRVWINRDRLSEIENFEAWIFKVVSTESLTFIRKEVKQKTKAKKIQFKECSIPPCCCARIYCSGGRGP